MGLAVDSAQILALPSLNSICRPGPGSVARLRFVCLNSRPRWDAVPLQRLALLMLYLTGTGTAMHPESATLESRVSIRVAWEREDSAGCLARQNMVGDFLSRLAPNADIHSRAPMGHQVPCCRHTTFSIPPSDRARAISSPEATLLCRVGTWQ